MRNWSLLLIASLLTTNVVLGGIVKIPKLGETKFDSWEFEKDEDQSYSEEHDTAELNYKNGHEKWNFDVFYVCKADKTDLCVCEKNLGTVNCRKDTRAKNAVNIDVTPLTTASITVDLKGFTPKYVYLTGNKITALSQRTLLPHIQSSVEGLDLSFNDIEFIEPNAFDSFPKLRKLRLNQNWLKISEQLDGWITDKLGKTLNILNLGYNSITSMNEGAFDALHNLTKLILDGNDNLALSAKTFGPNLQNLTELSLDDCNLSDLPADVFKNLPNLKYLSLIKNPLTRIPAGLASAPKLSVLDLSGTTIGKWDTSLLGDYPSIEKLFLKDMDKIISYGDCAFCRLKNLKYIDFSGSKQLASFDNNAFGFVTDNENATSAIQVVRFEDCALQTVTQIMLPWDKLNYTSIAGNPWNCNKELEWLTTDKSLHAFTGKTIPTCAAPPDLAGVAIQKLVNQASGSSQQAGNNGSFIHTLFYMGLSVGMIAVILTGVLYATNKFKPDLLPNLFARQRSGGAGFNNLNSNVGMDDDERVFEDDNDEFEARPAAV